jgi:hypothetical protein
MHPNLFGIAVRAPLPSGVLEVAHKLLLLGVHRDHRLLPVQCMGHTSVDVGELRVPIRMSVPLARLAVGLEAEPLLLEQFAHNRVTDRVTKRAQLCRQAALALAGPTQRRHRIATFVRRDQPQQIIHKTRISHNQPFPPTAGPPNAINRQVGPECQFLQAAADRAGRDTRCPCYSRDPTMPGSTRLNGSERSSPALVQVRREGIVAVQDRVGINHPKMLQNRYVIGESPTQPKMHPDSNIP